PRGELSGRDRGGGPLPGLRGLGRPADAGPDRPPDRRERGHHPKTLSSTEGFPPHEGEPIGGGLIAGICATCGLPKEICVCEDLGRETTQLSVEMDTRRYGKAVTVVRGLEFVQDYPDPVPGPDQVVVRVHAAALNHLDLFVREGIPTLKLTLPHILGSDGAGHIASVGSDVTDLEVGDRVVLNPGISCGR